MGAKISKSRDNVDHRQRCILVVDDEPLNMKLFTLALKKQGYRVLQAADGFRGFVRAHDDHPDLIVMDVQLPRLSGLEVTRTLKNSAHTKDIPIVIATAFLIDESTLSESACDAYMPKPFAIADFLALIDKLVSGKDDVAEAA